MGLFDGLLGTFISGRVSSVSVIDPDGRVEGFNVTLRGRPPMECLDLLDPLLRSGMKIDAGSIKHCGPRSAEGRN